MDDKAMQYYKLLNSCGLTSIQKAEDSDKDKTDTFEANYDGPTKTYKHELLYPEDKLDKVVALKILSQLKIIKGCALFFTILTILGFVIIILKLAV